MPQIGDEVQVVYRDPDSILAAVGVPEIATATAYGRLAASVDRDGHVDGIAVETDGGVLLLTASELVSVRRLDDEEN